MPSLSTHQSRELLISNWAKIQCDFLKVSVTQKWIDRFAASVNQITEEEVEQFLEDMSVEQIEVR